jgi:hypothetical protein
MLLGRKEARGVEAGLGFNLRRECAPSVTLRLGQRLILAPGLGGFAEGGAGASLLSGARVSRNNVAAKMEFTVPPPIDIAAAPATHGLALRYELGI